MTACPTTRWTRAAGAGFATSLIRRRVLRLAPPRQLRRSASYVTSSLMVMLTFLFFLHRELVDDPGFWIAGLIFLGLISVVVFFVGKWVLELLRAGKRH